MTAARDYDDLHHLVDRLSPAQARRLRLIITEDEELSRIDQEDSAPAGESDADDGGLPEGFLALFGGISAPADYAERIDDYNRERAQRHLGAAE
jgi:hypothetical protein